MSESAKNIVFLVNGSFRSRITADRAEDLARWGEILTPPSAISFRLPDGRTLTANEYLEILGGKAY